MGESGATDKAKGRLEEAAGSLLDDDDLKRKGKADQEAGKAKEKVGELIDKAKEFVTGEGETKKS